MKVMCKYCKKQFNKKASEVGRTAHNFCCKEHSDLIKVKQKTVGCICCGAPFIKKLSAIRKSPNNFCSLSCSAKWHNTHKTKGNRRSKLEIWLEQKLHERYSRLEIHFNRKDTIGSELDIYIPSLRLAFELNGVFHYEPIFGDSKFNQIRENDSHKFKLCCDLKIGLCVIDTTQMANFKEHRAQTYLDIITKIIDDSQTVLPIK
jgi:very-short-patch-repair endonuclease